MKFLRYGCSHSLWFPRGYKGQWLPQLNPIESCSHGKNRKRTFRFDEPIWLFRARLRLFAFAGYHRCGSREGSFVRAGYPKHDSWDFGADGNRTCSFCGGMHFDDFIKIAKLSVINESYAIEGTDKRYKYYVRQPGVRNAGEGAIKFYTTHFPEKLRPDDISTLNAALKLSHARFTAQMEAFKNANSVKA